jgi:hypothetical protein
MLYRDYATGREKGKNFWLGSEGGMQKSSLTRKMRNYFFIRNQNLDTCDYGCWELFCSPQPPFFVRQSKAFPDLVITRYFDVSITELWLVLTPLDCDSTSEH